MAGRSAYAGGVSKSNGVPMSNQLRRFLLDESALETVEWAILGGVIVATTAALFAAIGQDVFRAITSIGTATGTIP